MKKVFQAFFCGVGGSLIGFWAKSLDTIIGCLLFTLGIILLVGSSISIGRDVERDKEKTNSNMSNR